MRMMKRALVLVVELGCLLTVCIVMATPSNAQCRDARCLAGSTANASGDLLALFGTRDSGSLQVVNVSREVGQRISGPVTRWQSPDGEFVVEHLAGVNPDGDLLVFFWSLNSGNWQVVNVSGITGQRVVGPVVNWQTPDGPYTVEHLAGVAPDGRLLVFFWSPRADWQAVDLTAITGQRVANVTAAVTTLPGQQPGTGHQVEGPVVDWRTQEGTSMVENLAGLNLDGDLVVFSWSPQTDWQATNISVATGQRVEGPVTSWQVADGPANVENLAGVTAAGNLVMFFRTYLSTWRAVNISRITGKNVSGPVTSWIKSGVDHLAATGLNESTVYVFWAIGTGRQVDPGWGYCDIAQFTAGSTGCTNTLRSAGRF